MNKLRSKTNGVSRKVRREIGCIYAGLVSLRSGPSLVRGLVLGLVSILLLILSLTHPVQAAPGDLDLTFSGDGKVTTDFSGSSADNASGLAIQTNGKIVVAGSSDANGSFDFALARYNSNGSLDSTFSSGKVTTDFSSGNLHAANALAIQPDGKIVAAGYSCNLNEFGAGICDFALARYNANGSLDSTFSGDGKVTTNFGGVSGLAYALAIQADGKIVAAGFSNDDFALARYNSDGSLDSTFGSGGKVTTGIGSGDYAYALAIQTDGKIVVAGSSVNAFGNSNFALLRYNSNGSLDPTFGVGLTDFAGSFDEVRAIAIQANGKIVAAGFSFQPATSGSDDFALARYNSNGSLDSTFGSGGKVITDFGFITDRAFALAIQADSKIVAAGISDMFGFPEFALARYNSNGSLDTTFAYSGIVTTNFSNVDSSSEGAFAIAIQKTDGKLVVAGYSDASGTAGDFALARYQALACGGFNVTILGSSGGDLLPGTAGIDVINGLGGNDTISGLGGNDKICGGTGNDTINGGTGNDTLRGDSGDDALNGGANTDTCNGGSHVSGDTATNCETVTNVP